MAATARDGFEIVEYETGEIVRFIACDKSERLREKVEMGLLRNMDTEHYGVQDTRDAAIEGE
ncbi:MAG: hypothetical protein LC798_12860 [Chloroflexi bacterium]|nr:hypothetical protein [Chloroflexota bacterium]